MSLTDWLAKIAQSHPVWMDLGLDRIATVAKRLGLLEPDCPVITVTGTNGKGTCVFTLEQIYLAAGVRVGVFQSPSLFKVTEEIRLNGQDISEPELVGFFERIHEVKEEISLTLFEYMTLAALMAFKAAKVDLMVLEVGLGGRLDAVNIIDADLAVVTTIGVDHEAFLGKTRRTVAREKSGIFRAHRPVVCGDANPPKTLIHAAKKLGCPFFLTEAPALKVIELWQKVFPVSPVAIEEGRSRVRLPARFQQVIHPETGVEYILDVAHNPAASAFLSKKLRQLKKVSRTAAIFSMLKDKNIVGTLKNIHRQIDEWHVAPISAELTQRRAPLDDLVSALIQVGVPEKKIRTYPDLVSAGEGLLKSPPPDRVLVFGSFYTAQAILPSCLNSAGVAFDPLIKKTLC
jgi:dihydrofolate synthase/folylpolyglutamate synthase